MKINNQVSGAAPSAVTGDSIPEVKPGDTLQAVVKEKLPNQEAVIQTRGKEMRVQFEGTVPATGESVVVAVKQNDGNQIRVKVVDSSRPSTASSATDATVGKLTENYSADELRVVKMLADKGITVTKEREAALRSFLRTAQGELPQKLATVQAVIQKGLPLTTDHLSAVHEALNGPPVSKLLGELTGAQVFPEKAVQTGRNGTTDSKADTEMQQVLKLLADRGVRMTNEQEATVRAFLKAATGEVSQKAVTVELTLQRGAPMTAESLLAVHEIVKSDSTGKLSSESSAQANRYLNTDSKADTEVRQVLKLLADKGVRMTNEQEVAVRAFLEEASGEAPQKAATVEYVLQRGIPVTAESLLAVHQAINGNPANQVIVQSSTTSVVVPSNTSVTSSAQSVNVSTNTASSALQDLVQTILQKWGQTVGENISGLAEEVTAKLELSPVTIAAKSDSAADKIVQQPGETDKTSAAFQIMRQHVEKNSSLSEAIFRMKELVPSLAPEQAAQWEDTIQSLRRLQLTGAADKGQEMLRQFLQEGSTQAVASPKVVASNSADDRLDTVYSNAAAAGELELAARSILVTEVTKRLSQATQDFKTLKRDITRNLNQMAEMVKSTTRNIFPQVQAALDASIDKLDKAILKSDMTLLTDMGTEKQLLVASSRLADARKQLQLGNNAGARAILEDVSSKLEQMNWRPANVRVENVLYRQQMTKETMPTPQRLATEWDAISNSSGREHTARSVLDTIRAMGYSHDSDAARYLASSNDNGGSPGGGGGQQEHQQNVKALLLKLAQEDGASGRMAEQALNNLTGQQLLSKQDTGASMQSLMLSLPLMLSGRAENVKVIVNSRQEGEKVDWENCSLYFALQTRKLGDMGILATVADRHLSLTLKNDSPQFQERMEPLAALCREKLREIGFQIGPIRFSPLTQEEQAPPVISSNQPARPSAAPTPSLKGFDFKI